MKTNARIYLITRELSFYGNAVKAERIRRDARKKEKIDIKVRNGFAIQVIDKRSQYETKRKMISWSLPASTQ